MAAFSTVFAVAICSFALFGSTFVSSDSGSSSSKNGHISSGKGPIEGQQTLKFLYCYSCGYQKAFDQYSSILSEKYPNLNIEGANYDPSMAHLLAAKILSLAKMVIIIAIGSGINLFEYIGKQQPNWWIWCTSNKIYACLVVFFGSNMFEGMLISTGAFELYLNDIPVWSKLETGRIPQPAELLQIIDNYLLFESPYPV
ncbi:thioredoxin reductase-like selenoprotein T homolog CG3887 [Melanaphis sacchari]|uniref:SelT-like protein n=1 Tax=Melanaphis sacchari TaxID=742174 RepID=A0A2H8U2U7_9HEMI|nr:thioredoxin reductase-like selenoprotein T homolog CG3887 [Melanaphis sacchari]